jgi:signal transduction histidine kinase
MRWRAIRRVQPFADWALAGAMGVYGLTAGAVEGSPLSLGGTQSIVGPHPVVAVSFCLAGLVLAFRQRMPLAVLGAVMIVIGVPAAIYGSSEGFSPIAPIFVALYSVGAHAKMSRALAALGLYVGFWTLLVLRDPLNHTLSAVLWSWPAFLVGVMLLLLGAFLRTRRLYVAELRARAEQAESDREERIRAATVDERARIARELHDAVAHAMTVMVMQAEAADEMLDVDPIRARRALERVQTVGREGLAEMRRLLGVLRHDSAPAFAPQPGIASLQALVDEVSATGLPVQLSVEGVPRPISAGVDISAYRIVQEALTNAIKHAGARTVAVRLSYADDLTLEILDDGVSPVGSGENGHGLIGMQERVTLYGGTLRAGAAAGGGFSVHATLPIDGAS